MKTRNINGADNSSLRMVRHSAIAQLRTTWMSLNTCRIKANTLEDVIQHGFAGVLQADALMHSVHVQVGCCLQEREPGESKRGRELRV